MLTSLSSSSSSCCSNLNIHFCSQRSHHIKLPSFQVTCRSSFHDEGRGRQASMVDKNLGVLRERVEKMKLENHGMIKQREDNYEKINDASGWAYRYGYVYKHKKHASMALMQSFKMMLPVYGGLGLALLAGFVYVFFISIFFHLSKIISK